MNVLMQARSSATGLMVSWLAASFDFAGAGFPGPGAPEYVAVVSQAADAPVVLQTMVTVGPAGSGAAYETDGTADEVQLNAAITALATVSPAGGVVHLLAGTYTIDNPVNLKSKIVLEGAGPNATTILVSSSFSSTNKWAVGCAGTLTTGTAINLTSNATQGATTIAATAGSEFNAINAGDTLFLVSDAVWETLNQSGRKVGEFVKVVSKSSPNLTIYGMVRDSYLTTDTARLYRASFVEGPGIRNLAMKQAATLGTRAGYVTPMISFQVSRNASVKNCEIYNSDGPGVTDLHAVGTLVDGNYIHDLTDDSSNSRFGYGVLIGGCSEGTVIRSNRFDRMRHAVDAGPPPADLGLSSVTNFGVARAVSVSGNTALRIANVAYSTHSECDGWNFSGNVAEMCESAAFYMRGRSHTVVGNSVRWCSGGIQVGNTGVFTAQGGSGAGCHVIGNSIRHIKNITPGSTGTNFSGYGILLSTTDNTVVRGNSIAATDAAAIRLRPFTRRCMVAQNSILNANLANTANMPAVEIEANASGTAATITFSSGTCTVTGLTGIVNVCVGKNIVISGATTAANNGSFPILSVSGSNTVTYANASGATDAANGAIKWYVETTTDNVIEHNTASNTTASDYDRDVSGHAKYFARDGGSGGNTRNIFRGNTAIAMETDMFSLAGATVALSGNWKDGVVIDGSSYQTTYKKFIDSVITTDTTPTDLFTFPTVSGRQYYVTGYIEGSNQSGGGRWLYRIEAYYDNVSGTLTQRIVTPVTEVHESSGSATLTQDASGVNIHTSIVSISGTVRWRGLITVDEGRFS